MTISYWYDDSIPSALAEKPDRVEADGGHWHHQYGDGVTISVYHRKDVYPDC
jgi:hypothetical protein